MKITKELLVDAFKAARDAALQADPGEDCDTGTCNMDTPILRIPRVRFALIQEAAKEAQLDVSESMWLGKRAIFLYSPMFGQALRRTMMAEAAKNALAAKGLDARVYYQMD